jgi:hypothetical protein
MSSYSNIYNNKWQCASAETKPAKCAGVQAAGKQRAMQEQGALLVGCLHAGGPAAPQRLARVAVKTQAGTVTRVAFCSCGTYPTTTSPVSGFSQMSHVWSSEGLVGRGEGKGGCGGEEGTSAALQAAARPGGAQSAACGASSGAHPSLFPRARGWVGPAERRWGRGGQGQGPGVGGQRKQVHPRCWRGQGLSDVRGSWRAPAAAPRHPGSTGRSGSAGSRAGAGWRAPRPGGTRICRAVPGGLVYPLVRCKKGASLAHTTACILCCLAGTPPSLRAFAHL